MTAALDGYTQTTFTHEGETKKVFRIGSGPAVIVISEVPGITPAVAEFGHRVAAIGCTAVLPSLFGTPGAAWTYPRTVAVAAWACVSREFHVFALRKASPVTTWLRALAQHEHKQSGGPGIGVVGMCLTGGFALAMMVDDVVLAPVLSQPSLPFGPYPAAKRDLGISDVDLARIKQRCADEENLCVLGLRFTADRLVPAARFQRLREELGDKFVAVEIDSSRGNPYGNRMLAHSVLTEDLQDQPGHPTREALDEVLDLFRTRLL